MAFELEYTDNYKVRHDKCYCRILKAEIDYTVAYVIDEETVYSSIIVVGFYHDESSRRAGFQPFEIQRYSDFELSKKELSQYNNVRNLGYTHLKTKVPIFIDAKDI